ncbi:MAG: hypothetical protein EZS28_000867 [Streblomastix strix]|uniref:Uncharacterized protein n=1 Tax=Streblomastix strix TaxID=222440 RepID=A0A5J4X8V2_9EUKA|nr:MAG: hypothetical protein EZS28_000867 [Streblomastix strix]
MVIFQSWILELIRKAVLKNQLALGSSHAQTDKMWIFNSSVVTLDWGDVLELEGRLIGAKEARSLFATDQK